MGKKKRNASSEDESRGSASGTVQQKSNKKQKVNQEKEGRKGQKVNHLIHSVFSFFHCVNLVARDYLLVLWCSIWDVNSEFSLFYSLFSSNSDEFRFLKYLVWLPPISFILLSFTLFSFHRFLRFRMLLILLPSRNWLLHFVSNWIFRRLLLNRKRYPLTQPAMEHRIPVMFWICQ